MRLIDPNCFADQIWQECRVKWDNGLWIRYTDFEKVLYSQPTIETETITLEKAIDFLHDCGWLQEHDRVLTETRHGRWILEQENDDSRQVRCSECRMTYFVGKGRDGNYCPNCGAKMDKE